MNILTTTIFVLTFCFLLTTIAELLNIQYLKKKPPKELENIYEETAYKQSQQYIKENTIINIIQETINFLILIIAILTNVFDKIDLIIRALNYNSITSGVIYILILSVSLSALNLPFSIYKTFVIEEKFGFNNTTAKVFISDILKSTIISLILGIPLLIVVLKFFESTNQYAWLYCLIFITIIQLILLWISPTLIMPLFNKFTPIEEGELKESLLKFAKKESFQLSNVLSMDGSKRSSKANAFFTGFGKSRRVVLYDTLIEKQTTKELIGILAHEIGHYKHKHLLKNIITSIATLGITLYIFSVILTTSIISQGFNITHSSTYINLIIFGIMLTPINILTAIINNTLSRKYEFEADQYAVERTKDALPLINALKKLTKDNLNNLNPHPLKVWLDYSHPPLIKRIKSINKT